MSVVSELIVSMFSSSDWAWRAEAKWPKPSQRLQKEEKEQQSWLWGGDRRTLPGCLGLKENLPHQPLPATSCPKTSGGKCLYSLLKFQFWSSKEIQKELNRFIYSFFTNRICDINKVGTLLMWISLKNPSDKVPEDIVTWQKDAGHPPQTPITSTPHDPLFMHSDTNRVMTLLLHSITFTLSCFQTAVSPRLYRPPFPPFYLWKY